jgi:hypothetical protein
MDQHGVPITNILRTSTFASLRLEPHRHTLEICRSIDDAKRGYISAE